MRYSVLPTKEFIKDVRRLSSIERERIRHKIEEVAQDPTRYKQLHYALKGSSRIRIGRLRILFSYDLTKKELYLEKIIADHKYR